MNLKNLPEYLLSLYLVKCVVLHTNAVDAVVVAGLVGLIISRNYIEQSRIPTLKEELEKSHASLSAEITSIRNQLSNFNISSIKKPQSSPYKF